MIRYMDSKYVIPFGEVEYLRVNMPDYSPMSWDDVWEEFQDNYPNRWAIQFFPPKYNLVNDNNIYHLYMLPEYFIPDDFFDLSTRLDTVND